MLAQLNKQSSGVGILIDSYLVNNRKIEEVTITFMEEYFVTFEESAYKEIKDFKYFILPREDISHVLHNLESFKLEKDLYSDCHYFKTYEGTNVYVGYLDNNKSESDKIVSNLMTLKIIFKTKDREAIFYFSGVEIFKLLESVRA